LRKRFNNQELSEDAMFWGILPYQNKTNHLDLQVADVINKTKYLASWMDGAIK